MTDRPVAVIAATIFFFFGSLTAGGERANALAAPPARRASDAGLSRGVDFLIGSWRCTTFVGTKLTHDYSRANTDVMLVDSRVSLPNAAIGFIRERYRHHPDSATWTVALAKGAFVARAPDWVGDTWSFTGRTVDDGKAVPTQMVYETLGDDAFRRDFERAAGKGWQTYAGETCRRST